MNSPPFHYPFHYLHDSAIINVHTLLKPQPYQQFTQQHPSYYPPSSITHISSHTSPISFLQQQHHTPSISTTKIGSLVNQLLQSQEEFKHTLSVFANEVSLLKTTLTPSFNHNQPHQELIHTFNPFTPQQPQPNISSTPFNLQSPFSVSPNLHTHNQKPMQQQPYVSHKPFNHQQPHQTSTPQNQAIIPPPLFVSPKPTPQHVGLPAGNKESSMTMQQNQDNTKSSGISNAAVTVVEETFLVVSKADEKPTVYTATSFFQDSLYRSCFNLEKLFSTTTTQSTELRVARTVAIAERPPQHSRFFFDHSIFSIHIFDPGGTLIVAVCYAKRRRQIQNFKSYNIFPTTVLSPSHRVSVSLLSLVWEPWDRGKKSWNCNKNFPAPTTCLASL
ncbi:hypothetical protein QL285_072992 [Trifolium repens]|nr:hypothetical protein QL285_072992 [Trifolium repens]